MNSPGAHDTALYVLRQECLWSQKRYKLRGFVVMTGLDNISAAITLGFLCVREHKKSLLLKRIWITAKAPAPVDRLFNQGVLLTIAGILSAGRDLPRKRTSTGGLAPLKLKRVLELLDAEVNGDISLERLAREVCMSPFHFARAFKQSTGLSPHQYLMRMRIERACRLLETTGLSVPDIGLAVGYRDPSYLARIFRCILGVTPNEYRKRHRS